MPSAINDTMVQTLSDHFGNGMLNIFGNVLIIGLLLILIVLGILFVLGFTMDVAVPVIFILVLAMASRLPGASYPVLPPYTAVLFGIVASAIIVFAFLKFAKR